MCACPASPLVILRRVAERATCGASSTTSLLGTVPENLALCKIEEWDHLTAHLKYGTGFPKIPSWQEVPFFKPQKKIVLRNCGLINPDDIEEYIAVGGYQSLYKVLIDGRPGDGDRADQGLQAARARRRRLPHRPQMGFSAQGRGRPEIHHLQRR